MAERDTVVVAESAVPSIDRPYVDWSAVLAGAALSWALTFVMMTFGSGLGLSLTGSPWKPGMSAGWFIAASALWFIWVQVSSVMAGGYVAGRMRRRVGDATPHEVEVRDGIHGVLVWSVGAIVGGALLAAGAAGVVGTATVLTAGGATAVAAADDGESDIGYMVDRLFRPSAADRRETAAADAPARTSAAPDAPDASATTPAEPAVDARATAWSEDAEARREVRGIVSRAGSGAGLDDEDKRYIAQRLAAATGMSEQEAKQRVDGYLSTALTDMKEAAEKARKSAIVIAFIMAATFLVSGIAGWWAAGVGGEHRDEGRDLARWFRVR